jgi:heat shock protein HslJ
MKKILPALLFTTLFVSCQTKHLPLTDVEWKLTSLHGKDYTNLSPPITLTLSPDNKMAGHAGCNRYFGSYTKKDADLSFSGLGSTKMYCPDKMEAEDAFLKAMGEVNRHVLTSHKLVLKKEDSVLMEFTH